MAESPRLGDCLLEGLYAVYGDGHEGELDLVEIAQEIVARLAKSDPGITFESPIMDLVRLT